MRLLLSLLLVGASLVPVGAQNTAGVDPLEPARREFLQGKFDAALAALDRVTADDGAVKGKLLDLRGLVYLEQQKYDEALAAFRAARDADPAVFPQQAHFGDTLLRQGKWEEAREAYEEVMRSSNVLMVHEALRYGVLLTYLGEKDDAGAKEALDRITFPSESPAYYYAQSAWAYAHGEKSAGDKWLRSAEEMFKDRKQTSWFARPLYDLGWIKTKPPLVVQPLAGG